MKPQRYLAAAGFGSRRSCEKLILEGRVTINGLPMQFNMDVQAGDDVRVDGQPATAEDERVFIALHKPAGYISDRGVATEVSALDLVNVPQRLFAVGRLDKDATGLLLLTNDGEIAHHLTHPRYEHEKEYRVLVTGHPDETTLDRWRKGVWLNGELTAQAGVSVDPTVADQDTDSTGNATLGQTWLRVVLHEGRKRQIKRVAKSLGHPVIRLVRIRIGEIELGDLKPGQWRHLTQLEIDGLRGTTETTNSP